MLNRILHKIISGLSLMLMIGRTGARCHRLFMIAGMVFVLALASGCINPTFEK